MANYVGLHLSRLIKERAYRQGEIESLEDEIKALRAQIRKNQRTIKANESAITQIDEDIQSLSAIDPDDIRSIRAKPRKTKLSHGAIRNEIVHFLQGSHIGVRIDKIVEHISETFEIPMNTPQLRKEMFDCVRRPLNKYREKGAVERLADCPITKQGVWRWTSID